MDQVYALGVTIIEFVQEWFSSSERYFKIVNDISNPQNTMEFLFPAMSVIDSVFAAQLLLCCGFGNWLNAVLKWWLLEERPYWWVHETEYYEGHRRPALRQTLQSCETGPGCPSGHSQASAMVAVLLVYWVSHVASDRKWSVGWLRYAAYPALGAALGSVMLARIYIGTHFPHQTLAGAALGGFLAPALCIYVSDPYIWRYGCHATRDYTAARLCHVLIAGALVAIGAMTFLALKALGVDPLWTVEYAFRWCEHSETIHVSTTPMFALADATGHLLGWAIAVTPAVAQYRHYTRNRSLILSTSLTLLVMYLNNMLQDQLTVKMAWRFYAYHYGLNAIKTMLLLRVVPFISLWPFRNCHIEEKDKKLK